MQRINNKKGLLTQEEAKRYTYTFWKIILGCLAILFLFLASVRLGAFGKLPTFTDLENPQSNLASEVISSDG
jgi:penicillin-binding protein 1A